MKISTKLCFIALLISNIIGFLNPKVNFASLFVSIWYIIIYLIDYMTVRNFTKLISNKSLNINQKKYLQYQLQLATGKVGKSIVISGYVLLGISSIIVCSVFTFSDKYSLITFFAYDFFANNLMSIYKISLILYIIVPILFIIKKLNNKYVL